MYVPNGAGIRVELWNHGTMVTAVRAGATGLATFSPRLSTEELHGCEYHVVDGAGKTVARGGFGLPEVAAPRTGHIEASFLRRFESLPPDSRQLVLAAAAEPVGDVTLLWRAAERLGIGADAVGPAESAELIALDPSPTAAATRLIEPARTSPTAMMAGTLVSNGSGRRPSAAHSGPSESAGIWASGRMRPRYSRARTGSQSWAGAAPR